ncbi:hypothetical protein AMATHDRAFT_140737 [Amanita thiersii Skay4041]|uniref:Alpha/beta hydrolase fold-3 domain-containing protein n=1 Tax=Amanita thiersii Skay4041 TaxID=703135 RepID=A0A2A9NV63_9AGAR|nr:hypothetical protein AMATHDRAFT_140737 [Amanita thiersii Skay4041]
MPLNSLSTDVGLRVAPVVLETLIKHYFDRLKKNAEQESGTPLKRDELLYHEAFNIVKAFLKLASQHTVEEVQAFSNMRTPSPPWTHIIRLRIPISPCNKAASYLVQAFGGEEQARVVVGGVKWWQVRGIDGIEAEWITSKKDWLEAKKRQKINRQKIDADTTAGSINPADVSEDSAKYDKAMDEMRCILYIHGVGGYYFGSVDQERYSIQRHARKINGRVFAVNYRLAPQYPFPCALQDVLAAYLYLTDPPPGADHSPVNPSHIIIAGDSAGGGLSLALLQVLRDVGLPLPAGGVLISPWCDLTHSFPSIHTNTDTDVIPPWGLSLQKPSILWPPPCDEQSRRVHDSLRSRIRQVLRHRTRRPSASSFHSNMDLRVADCPIPVNVGSTTAVPSLDPDHNQTITLATETNEKLIIKTQVHMYTTNSLIAHPLVSPAFSYLGGLPPLLFIASDKEVLRDEIIYTAHKAANPSKYGVHPSARDLYAPLHGIEEKHQSTKVHLQVYDDTAHVLPVLFSFTTPAKYCFRAIATFCKHVSGMKMNLDSPTATSSSLPNMKPSSASSDQGPSPLPSAPPSAHSNSGNSSVASTPPPSVMKRTSLRRSLSAKVSHAAHVIQQHSSPRLKKLRQTDQDCSMPALPEGDQHLATKPKLPSRSTSDVAGSRFRALSSPLPRSESVRYAGDPSVYGTSAPDGLWLGPMIRERVSTQGVIRALEQEFELVACNMPPDVLGRISERAMRRYLEGSAKFTRKFAKQIKLVEKHRRQTLERAEREATKHLDALCDSMKKQQEEGKEDTRSLSDFVPSWNSGWSWILDGNEQPPPSSIVARRDTEEAQKLAEIADRTFMQGDQVLSGNNLWSIMVNFFTITPDKDNMDSTPTKHRPEHKKVLSDVENIEKQQRKRFLC